MGASLNSMPLSTQAVIEYTCEWLPLNVHAAILRRGYKAGCPGVGYARTQVIIDLEQSMVCRRYNRVTHLMLGFSFAFKASFGLCMLPF